MKSYYLLSPRHRQLLDSMAGKLLAASRNHQSISPATLLYAGSWSHGDGERLHTAFRNLSAYGHAHYRNPGNGRRAERRLNEARWSVWKRIMKKAEADLIQDGHLTRVNPDAPWYPCPESMQDYFLEVLPPSYFTGGFGCPEAHSHTPKGHPILLCFRFANGQWHCRYATRRIAEFTVPAAA